MSTRISVIVCTFDHAQSLLATLHSLAAIDFDATRGWELIVVDNNSSDGTARTVREFAGRAGVPVQYAFEGRQGLSYARNCGMALAHGEIIAFTDDDVRVSANWLTELDREFSADPAVALVCGRTIPVHDGLYPLGVKDSPDRTLYRHPSPPLHIGIGNNLAVRRSVARQVGTFDVQLGAGTRCGAAEDTDYIYRVLKSGHPVLYTPAAVVRHDHDRVAATDISRIECNYRRGYAAFVAKHALRGDRWMIKLGWWDQRSMWRALLSEPAQRRDNWRLLLATWQGYVRRLVQELGWLDRELVFVARRKPPYATHDKSP